MTNVHSNGSKRNFRSSYQSYVGFCLWKLPFIDSQSEYNWSIRGFRRKRKSGRSSGERGGLWVQPREAAGIGGALTGRAGPTHSAIWPSREAAKYPRKERRILHVLGIMRDMLSDSHLVQTIEFWGLNRSRETQLSGYVKGCHHRGLRQKANWDIWGNSGGIQ